jgi:ATP-dependent DNA helicase RecG
MEISYLSQIACSQLKGVGPKLAESLRRCGIESVQDLLFHLPFRYEDRTQITPIKNIRVGDHVVVQGVVKAVEVTYGRRRSLLCQIADETGDITLRFFYFTAQQHNALRSGTLLRCFGEVRGWQHVLEMIHPEYQFVKTDTLLPLEKGLTPVYPTTEGLAQRQLRNLTDQALRLLKDENSLPDYLKNFLTHAQFPSLAKALHYVHRPPVEAPVNELLSGKHPAQQRLAFEELLAHNLSLRQLRQLLQQHPAPVLYCHGQLVQAFLAQLSFQLTQAQQRVLQEIQQDLIRSQPMLRLLQGDVGSGKTVIAALAALQAVENHYQAVLMAPTELLAEQHLQNFSKWLAPLNIKVAWLAGKLKSKARREMLAMIADGSAQIVVGTHALFQDEVQFAKLGLVLIDEQHRFGVHQRLALRDKGIQAGMYPHQLVMTATPIPRTLAMTAYADLDTSVIDELPPGRTPIQTVVMMDKHRDTVVERVQQSCMENKQVYWVCPLIEESDVLQCQAAETTFEQLKLQLPELNIGLVHGRMTGSQKEAVMAEFKTGTIHLLVATTVIEVGVDVPNASLMIIENAERLGLSQLHQLRGRVGRGSTASFCVLLYQYPLSAQAKARLTIMRETNDGFAIAKRDLELRGPGEVLGTRQTGMLQLRIADLLRDGHLLPKVQQMADFILQQHPALVKPLMKRWLAQKEQYGAV